LIQVATNSFPAAYGPPYAVDIITNGSQAFWTGIQTNTIYYVVPQATNNMWLTVYSNYTDAAFSAANYRTNQIPIIATGNGALDTLLYLTNYTSFNADVIQVITPPTTIRTAVYDVYFRTTSSQTPYYYVTSESMETGTANNGSIVNFSGDNIITTNKFRIATIRDDGSMINSPLIQVLVNPQ
jgi:hypothetical protein